MAKKKIPDKFQIWIEARTHFHLSHTHIQMARELGMNPKNFGKLANHRQERWKAPLPKFIERIYFKRFGKPRPEVVKPVEQIVKDMNRKKEERKQRRREKKEALTEDNAAKVETPAVTDANEMMPEKPLPF